MSLRFAVLTVSDRSWRGERPDASGPALIDKVKSQGWVVVRENILPDDLTMLREFLISWCDRGDMDVILTTGGTGFAPRDVTPEATRAVIEREAPGLAEAMRTASARARAFVLGGLFFAWTLNVAYAEDYCAGDAGRGKAVSTPPQLATRVAALPFVRHVIPVTSYRREALPVRMGI